MRRRTFYILIGIITFCVRLYFEYRTYLIPGIGGGYNPVQIRAIIETGRLAFTDVPFVFYLNACFVKLLSLFITNQEINELIINVVKIAGSASVPLLLIPLFLINEKLTDKNITGFFEFSLVAFSVLSFSPLELSAEATKNALGLSFMTMFIFVWLQYFKTQKIKFLIITLLLLLLIAITHFGVFSISILFFVIGLVIVFKRKAIIPIIATIIAGALFISIFDPERAKSMFLIWAKAFKLPFRLFFYPQGILYLVLSIFIILIITRVLKESKNKIPPIHRKFLQMFFYFIIFLAFPFFNFELGRRLGLMLFVPQTIVLLLIYPYLNIRLKKIIPVVALIIVTSSVIYNCTNPKEAIISQEAYNDIRNIKEVIKDPEETLIYTRHGMEYWIIWDLRTKIAQPQIRLSDKLISDYSEILFLKQKKGWEVIYPGFNNRHLNNPVSFMDPVVPEQSTLIYSSEYYDLYILHKK